VRNPGNQWGEEREEEWVREGGGERDGRIRLESKRGGIAWAVIKISPPRSKRIKRVIEE